MAIWWGGVIGAVWPGKNFTVNLALDIFELLRITRRKRSILAAIKNG
ncbi:hypothetical protein [Lacticaseibacillus nasuensis]|nr:hypothetical protein [Lacticaseibacillus nasuensis]